MLTPRPKSIEVMTLGVCIVSDTVTRSPTARELQKMGNGKGRGKGRGPDLDHCHDMFDIILNEAGKNFDKLVVLDSRMFQDPQSKDRYCVGVHAEKQNAVVRHAAFPDWMKDARTRIERAFESMEPGATLAIVVYCRKGAHRSVACASVLHYALQENLKTFEGAHLLPIHHFSKEHFWQRKYCGECEKCVESHKSFLMSDAELPSTFPLTYHFPPADHFPTRPIHLPANPFSLPPIHFLPTHHFPTKPAGQPFDERCPPTDRRSAD